MKMRNKVLIVMGSDSDLPVMREAGKMLSMFSIPYEMRIASAHRSPELLNEIVANAEKDGTAVIIAGAGAAAHLAGAIAARTVLPVIGVPIDSSPLKGVDALYSTVQMPPACLWRRWPSGLPAQRMPAYSPPRSLRLPAGRRKSS